VLHPKALLLGVLHDSLAFACAAFVYICFPYYGASKAIALRPATNTVDPDVGAAQGSLIVLHGSVLGRTEGWNWFADQQRDTYAFGQSLLRLSLEQSRQRWRFGNGEIRNWDLKTAWQFGAIEFIGITGRKILNPNLQIPKGFLPHLAAIVLHQIKQGLLNGCAALRGKVTTWSVII
jgi:hypothetical protein